ncbi:hypothetical protein UB45_08300 [Terrabacter sp. 28]|nr:hypothetical protein UB45_08300 [Terrabacter sp. 28]
MKPPWTTSSTNVQAADPSSIAAASATAPPRAPLSMTTPAAVTASWATAARPAQRSRARVVRGGAPGCTGPRSAGGGRCRSSATAMTTPNATTPSSSGDDTATTAASAAAPAP